MNISVLRFDTLGSTNTEAANQARLGAAEGLCVIARRQTAGRGRRGRSWTSEQDAGLYFSIVLRPKIDPAYLPLITLMAGVVVHDALNNRGLLPDIKWPNDILVSEKKIAGILAETVETDSGLAVVVGIGINLKANAYPQEVAENATSVEEETDEPVDPQAIVSSLTTYFRDFYDVLCAADGPANIVYEWRRRSTYYDGKAVRVTLDSEMIDGLTDGLEENGALRVKTDDDSVRVVQAGDVERLRTV